MSCYYDYFINACICEEKIEQIPVSEIIYFLVETFNV